MDPAISSNSSFGTKAVCRSSNYTAVLAVVSVHSRRDRVTGLLYEVVWPRSLRAWSNFQWKRRSRIFTTITGGKTRIRLWCGSREPSSVVLPGPPRLRHDRTALKTFVEIVKGRLGTPILYMLQYIIKIS